MSERNKRKEILRSFEPFVRNLAKLGVDNFNKNSEAIGTLNALVEKCKTYSEHIYQEPSGNYCIDSDIGFDADFDDNFDVNKILPLVENIWDEYNEKLSHIMVYKMFTVLGLSLLSKSAESITTEQIRRIFRLGENVLKSKIKFINDQIATVCSVSDVFSELVGIIANGNFEDFDVLEIFKMLCDVSFDFVDTVNDIKVINNKNYFAPWALGDFVLPPYECKETDVKNNVTKYVWERAKKTLNNGITKENIGIAGGMFFVLNKMLENMLENENIVDKDITNVSVINDDFPGVLKLVADVLKSEYSDDQPLNVAMGILWDIKLLKITKAQNKQVDETLKSLGLKFENGEIVIKDKNIFDKLPKNSAIKSAIQIAQDYAICHYTEEVRNGSKNTEANKTDNGKKIAKAMKNKNENKEKNENEPNLNAEIHQIKKFSITFTFKSKYNNLKPVIVEMDFDESTKKILPNNKYFDKMTDHLKKWKHVVLLMWNKYLKDKIKSYNYNEKAMDGAGDYCILFLFLEMVSKGWKVSNTFWYKDNNFERHWYEEENIKAYAERFGHYGRKNGNDNNFSYLDNIFEYQMKSLDEIIVPNDLPSEIVDQLHKLENFCQCHIVTPNTKNINFDEQIQNANIDLTNKKLINDASNTLNQIDANRESHEVIKLPQMRNEQIIKKEPEVNLNSNTISTKQICINQNKNGSTQKLTNDTNNILKPIDKNHESGAINKPPQMRNEQIIKKEPEVNLNSNTISTKQTCINQNKNGSTDFLNDELEEIRKPEILERIRNSKLLVQKVFDSVRNTLEKQQQTSNVKCISVAHKKRIKQPTAIVKQKSVISTYKHDLSFLYIALILCLVIFIGVPLGAFLSGILFTRQIEISVVVIMILSSIGFKLSLAELAKLKQQNSDILLSSGNENTNYSKTFVRSKETSKTEKNFPLLADMNLKNRKDGFNNGIDT